MQYLIDLGFSEADVIAIVASHWDDDHIQGFSELVSRCKNADIILSQAFGQKDFLAYARSFNMPLTARARAGPKELYQTVKLCRESKRDLTYALPCRRVIQRTGTMMAHGCPVELWTLSPSDAEYTNFLAWVTASLPTTPQTRRLSVGRKRNDLTTVVLLIIGNDALLFGGDLEEEGKPNTGWSAIVGQAARPIHRAGVFKVAHHGSANGDFEGIWLEMLTATPNAIVAPWIWGNGSLPTGADLDRLSARTSEIFIASKLSGGKVRRRKPTVDQAIKESTKSMAAVRKRPGIVRLRKAGGVNGAWSIETFGAAFKHH